MYHEFLQKVLVDRIAARHFKHWRMELLTFGGPGSGTEERFEPLPDAKDEPAKVLSVEELRRIFAYNRFASVHMPPGEFSVAAWHYTYRRNTERGLGYWAGPI